MAYFKAVKGGSGGGFSYSTWLSSGGLSPSGYANLAAVLADEEAVRRLMTIHASVDYLVQNRKAAEIATIINNNYCAKWINLRDFAYDNLSSDFVIGQLMDTADKYGYGEWVEDNGTWGPKGNVPIMTAASAPYGTASNYEVFDGDNTTTASATEFSYNFTNPVCVKKYDCLNSSGSTISGGTLSGSNDGTNWTTISAPANNTSYYLYYKVSFAASTTVATIQYYGREMKVSVPVMTSNTAPCGEVKASNEITPAYKAFNGEITHVANDRNWWSGGTGSSPWIQYQFTHKVKIKKICLVALYNNDQIQCKDFKIQGSNDGFVNDVHEIYQGHLQNDTSEPLISFDIVDDEYLYYRLTILSTYSTGGWKALRYLQFYGEDYTERDWDADHPRKYLYDHGVELETMTLSGTATKENEAIKLSASGASALHTLDTTSYNLLRGVMGSYGSGTNALKCGSASANFVSGNLPFAQGLDISSVSGSNATGVAQTATGVFTAEEIWMEG